MFFCEPQTLATLTHQALGARIRAARPTDPLRVWVPACATGEEAYTLALCLLEQSRALGAEARLRIFATERDEAALHPARAGVYPGSALRDIPSHHLAEYFEPLEDGRMRVRAAVRELITFATHDALRDPPIFSRLDLISGRNLPAHPASAQARRFAATARFALRADGWLLLAAGADACAVVEGFVPLAVTVPLYRKAPEHTPAALDVSLRNRIGALETINDDLSHLIDNLDVAAVFLEPDQRIVHFTNAAERLLGIGVVDLGRPLETLASPLIDAKLPEAVRRALATDEAVHTEVCAENHSEYLRTIRPQRAASRVHRVVITWADITRVKVLQEEISRIAALEQQRIGEELHDGVQQELAALGLFAQNLRETLEDTGTAQARQWAARLTEGIAALGRQVRSLAHGLVPVPIEADNLAPALAALARGTREFTAVPCEFALEGDVRLRNADAASHLYRIAQEAVRNAIRHAQADRIAIRLGTQDGTVRLEVRDNGIGMPPTGVGRGLGLRLMEHRCALIGGTFSAQREPGGGTRIACAVPNGEA